MTTEPKTMKTQETPTEVGIDVQRLVLPCPFCGEQPKFTEHFREKGLFNMIHRCKVIGGISWDWSDYERQVTQWNTRQNGKDDAWKQIAIRLSKCLNRHGLDCHELSHRKSEYHNSDEPCPVVAEILKANEDFDNLLSNGKAEPPRTHE